MMRRQSFIALAVAVVFGLIAVFLANTYWSARDRNADVAEAGTIKVAVAAVPLDYGTQVTPDKVQFVSYPARSLPPGVFKSLDELMPMGKQRVALRPILPNQLLLAADLTGEGQNASIAALLPDGMRAASVRIDDVSGVAGFVKPNDTVDVLITRQAIGEDRDARITDVLLQNVRVIAMDQQAKTENNEAAVATVARTATLEVTPIDAQKMALGQQLGSLSLVLRKPGEEQNVAYVDTVSLEDLRADLYGSSRAAAPQGRQLAENLAAPAAAAAAPRRLRAAAAPRRPVAAPKRVAPATSKVEITRGTVVSNYEVGGYVR